MWPNMLALLTLLLLFDKYNYRAVEVEDHSTLKFGGKFVDILCLFGWFVVPNIRVHSIYVY